MSLDWWTLALQTVNFLVLVWLLWRFLYRPVRKVIERRRELAGAAMRDAEERANAADTERRALEAERADLAEERQSMLKRMHDDLERERAAIRQEAERDAQTIVEESRAALAEERIAAIEESRDEMIALATDIAATLLKRADSEALYAATLDRIDAHLSGLGADQRAHLLDDLSRNGRRVQVVTAMPLSPDAQCQWQARLAPHLGEETTVAFDSDEALVGGAELHFPHAQLRFSWEDQLKQTKELLAGHGNGS